MPSIGAVMAIRRSRLWNWIERQPDPQRARMSIIMRKQDELNRCWPWQRKKIKAIKSELDKMHSDWPNEFKAMYNFWSN